jgi:hypothetical protein
MFDDDMIPGNKEAATPRLNGERSRLVTPVHAHLTSEKQSLTTRFATTQAAATASHTFLVTPRRHPLPSFTFTYLPVFPTQPGRSSHARILMDGSADQRGRDTMALPPSAMATWASLLEASGDSESDDLPASTIDDDGDAE